MNKTMLNNLEKMKEQIDAKIESREFSFDEKSERWQDSDAGEAYREKTDQLQDVRDNIDFAIDYTNTFLES